MEDHGCRQMDLRDLPALTSACAAAANNGTSLLLQRGALRHMAIERTMALTMLELHLCDFLLNLFLFSHHPTSHINDHG